MKKTLEELMEENNRLVEKNNQLLVQLIDRQPECNQASCPNPPDAGSKTGNCHYHRYL